MIVVLVVALPPVSQSHATDLNNRSFIRAAVFFALPRILPLSFVIIKLLLNLKLRDSPESISYIPCLREDVYSDSDTNQNLD